MDLSKTSDCLNHDLLIAKRMRQGGWQMDSIDFSHPLLQRYVKRPHHCTILFGCLPHQYPIELNANFNFVPCQNLKLSKI